MDSADNNVKADMKHMEYKEDHNCGNKDEVAVHDGIVIDPKVESRVKYVAPMVLAAPCEINVLMRLYSGEKSI